MSGILSGSTRPYPGLIQGQELILPGHAMGSGGGGGKSGKGGGAFSEAKNTNRSRAIVRLIDLLSEGPILGLEDGSKSIFLNNTPLVGPDGRDNFLGVSWEMRLGLVDQEPIKGFPIAENTVSVETEVKQSVGPAVRTYASDTATLARVVLRFPALFFQDTKNNKLTTTPLNYTIEIRPEGGSYAVAHNVNFRKGKWMAPYEKEHLIVLPPSPTNGWDIRVTKITEDPDALQDSPSRKDNASFKSNSVIWASTGLVTERKLTYPNSALIAISFDSSTFGNSLPERWYKLKGRLVKVPSNFDPVTRTYATSGSGVTGGMWDGVTFKVAWTNNPAWVCYDALINTRYASGLDENLLTLTRFELYVIGQYCDELVPDGYGGFEPRYSLNAWINTADEAYRFLQRLVQTFRGMSYWAAGQVSIASDMPAEPVKIVTNANVVDGEFVYEGASLKTMHTMARVSYREPNLRYETDIEPVDDPVRLALFGERVIDIEAFGCTSRAEAHRLGKWALDTEAHSTEMVTYETALDQVDLRPGDVVMIQDQWREGVRAGGRVREAGSNWVLLDAKFAQTSSGYQISTVRPDGDLQLSMNVASFDDTDPDYTKVTVVGTFAAVPLVGSVWVIATDDVPSRQFRILAIQEHKKAMAKVTGLFHDPTKYARVELGIDLTTDILHIQTPLADPIPPPTAVDAMNTVYGDGVVTIPRLTASATPARDGRIVGHEFRATNEEDDTSHTLFVSDATADFDNLPAGDYTVSARSIGADNRSSNWLDKSTLVTVTPVRSTLLAITDVVAEGGIRRVLVSWVPPDDRTDIRSYQVWRADTELADPEDDGAVLVDTTYATQTVDAQHGVLLPGTTWYYWVRAIDLTNQVGPFSDPDSATVQTVATTDVGNHVITHEKIMYTGITRIVHDELTLSYDARDALDTPILSITVDVDRGGKVAVIGRVYTPNLDMTGGEEPYGGGGGTDIPDPDFEDPYTTDPLDTGTSGTSVMWVSGGGSRAAFVFDQTGIGGQTALLQQRTPASVIQTITVELDLDDGIAGFDKIEAAYPVMEGDTDINWSGTFNFAAKIDAGGGQEVSLDEVSWYSTIDDLRTATHSWSGNTTSESFPLTGETVTVYWRPIGGPTTGGSDVFTLSDRYIPMELKDWLYRADVKTSTTAVATGLFTATDIETSALQTFTTGLDVAEVNLNESVSDAFYVGSIANTPSATSGTSGISAGYSAVAADGDTIGQARAQAMAGATIASGHVAENDFVADGVFLSETVDVTGTSFIVLGDRGFSAYNSITVVGYLRSALSAFDAAGYFAIRAELWPSIVGKPWQTGSQEILALPPADLSEGVSSDPDGTAKIGECAMGVVAYTGGLDAGSPIFRKAHPSLFGALKQAYGVIVPKAAGIILAKQNVLPT